MGRNFELYTFQSQWFQDLTDQYSCFCFYGGHNLGNSFDVNITKSECFIWSHHLTSVSLLVFFSSFDSFQAIFSILMQLEQHPT